MFQNVRYFLTDIHFHRPSEHIIDGQVHEIEFHLVHTSEQQKNLVVGVICTFDTEAVELDKVDIQSKWDFPNHLQTFSPAIFLPQNQSYFHYTGSLNPGLAPLGFRICLTCTQSTGTCADWRNFE